MAKLSFNPLRAGVLALLLTGSLAHWHDSSPSAAASAKRLPNIIVVYVDDLGYGDIGSFGATGYATPNLDRLAREGTRMTDFYVAQAVCSASRASLLTGCYPNRVGILGALNHTADYGISANEKIGRAHV